MRAAELVGWWKEVPAKRKTYERLSPRGAVASQLAFQKGDVVAVVRHFHAESARLSRRYPTFWRDVLSVIRELEWTEVEAVALASVIRELETGDSDPACPNGKQWCGSDSDRLCGECAADRADYAYDEFRDEV